MNIYKELEIIRIIFKDFLSKYSSRSLSRIMNMGHSGVFKIMKKLEKKGIVVPERIGRAVIYSVNMENPIAVKELEFALMLEAHQYPKWLEEFKALKFETKFTILFGSVLRNEKEARDIDMLIVAEKRYFKRIKKYISGKNNLMVKKVHLILQNEKEFLHDFKLRNKAIIEIIKTGAILFGQDEFIKLVSEK